MSRPNSSSPRHAAVITTSDGLVAGTRKGDESGDVVERLLREAGFEQVDRVLLPDDRARIESELIRMRESGVPLIVTTGGTGLGPRDVTPEATTAVVDRPAPGLAEAMRSAGLRQTPFASLSRAVAGVSGRSLILNLPGSPKGARESLEAVVEVLPHALALLAGGEAHH